VETTTADESAATGKAPNDLPNDVYKKARALMPPPLALTG